MQSEKTTQRCYDLDWLRVYAILAVFVFHSSRFFDMGGWHVKNPTTYFVADIWVTFMANWLMPFIFMISGASLYYALGSRGARKFMEDKVKRCAVRVSGAPGQYPACPVRDEAKSETTNRRSGSQRPDDSKGMITSE